MAITFPTNPIVGSQFTYGGVTYNYTAQGVWLASASYVKTSFSAYPNANQTIANEVGTKVLFQTATINDVNRYDTSTSRWTPPAGRVQIIACVYCLSGLLPGTPIWTAIYKNGAELCWVAGSAIANYGSANMTYIDSCNGTDYYEIWIYIFTGTTATIQGLTPPYTFFMGTTL